MVLGSGLARLDGYPFEVRYSDGALVRARVAADLAADAYVYLGRLFSRFEPDIVVIVAGEKDWHSRQPYGLPFFNDDEGQIRPGIVVVPAGSGTFWKTIARDIRDASPRGYARLRATYPDGEGGVDLQPFFDLVTVHELGHAFEILGTSGCRRCGWERSSPTWCCMRTSPRGGGRNWTRSTCSPPSEHRAGGCAPGCRPRVIARWTISRPTTRAGNIRWACRTTSGTSTAGCGSRPR